MYPCHSLNAVRTSYEYFCRYEMYKLYFTKGPINAIKINKFNKKEKKSNILNDYKNQKESKYFRNEIF